MSSLKNKKKITIDGDSATDLLFIGFITTIKMPNININDGTQ